MISKTKKYHNRFLHSLDVCFVAQFIAEHVNRTLQEFDIKPVNKELLKVVSLAHDIGHPPFGHTGERVLDKIMASRISWCRMSHTRILTLVCFFFRKDVYYAFPQKTRESRHYRSRDIWG
jgi:dGTP triphosphohydrolase